LFAVWLVLGSRAWSGKPGTGWETLHKKEEALWSELGEKGPFAARLPVLKKHN
jgi:hypothetical protein